VDCANCKARFIAYYGADEDDIEHLEVNACGLCRGDPTRKDDFAGKSMRIIADTTIGGYRRER